MHKTRIDLEVVPRRNSGLPPAISTDGCYDFVATTAKQSETDGKTGRRHNCKAAAERARKRADKRARIVGETLLLPMQERKL